MKKNTLIKPFALLVALFCAVNFGFGQSTLAPGDIAITGFNSGSPYQLTFVLLKDVSNTTQINFTDNGWNLTDGLRNFEGTLTWEANSDLPCGTEIFLERVTNSNLTTSHGTLNASGSFVLNSTNDQILAYQGTNTSPSFIYAIHYGPDNWSNAIDSSTTAIPSGLTDGVNAVYIGDFNFGNYTCTVTSNQSLILAAVSTPSNWFRPSTRITTLGGCSYTCVQCPTTVTWNGSVWSNGTGPTLSLGAEINGNYDTLTNGSFSACSLTVNTGYDLTVSNGDYVEVKNDVVANGGILVNTQANFIQNSDTASFTDNSGGLVVVSKEKTSQAWYSYTYWGSPVENENIEVALGATPTNRRFTFIAANFIDNDTEIGNTNTFISGTPDGLDDNGNDWLNTPTGPMVPGVGYAATAGELAPFFPITEIFNFYGKFNNGEILVPLVSNSGGAYEDWNLVGNPYPCAISADQFFTLNSGVVDAIYLWDQGTPPSSANSGGQAVNFSADDYAIINAGTGEIGARANTGVPPSRFIPSGQGFFVDANFATNLVFNNSMRSITNDNSQFFKNTKEKAKSSIIANKLWLNLTSDNGAYYQILVGYVNGATDGNDGAYYDTPRSLSSKNSTSFYSVIEDSNSKFAIQGKAANSINEDETIQLGFKTTIDVPTLYKLSIAQLEGDFLTNSPIYLIDNLLNKVHNLSVCDYTFTSEVGEFNRRFEIAFTNKTLADASFTANANSVKITSLDKNSVSFKASNNLNISQVSIFDVLGRTLYTFKGKSNEETFKLSNLNQTVFIAKITLSNGAIITKKAVLK